MNTTNKLNKILKKIKNNPNVESALLETGANTYFWYRFRYFILSSFIFYVMFFIKMAFLGSDYTSFYTTKILVFEQVVFWFAQLFWYFIILIQKERNSLLNISYKIDPKVSVLYSALVSAGISFYLYKNGLLVFERLTIYGAVSFIFIAQIFFIIHLKYLHSHVYAHKRVYINMPLVIGWHFILLILQIYLWKIYHFWSIPIVFGIQVLTNLSIKYYYYLNEFKERTLENSVILSFKEILKFVFSKKIILSCFMILPEVFYFLLVRLYFLNTVDYAILIFLLSALMNSRISGLLLQDFLKYSEEKYNALILSYLKKVILPLILTTLFLFIQGGAMNYFVTKHFDLKIIIFSCIVSMLLGLSSLLSNYFFFKGSCHITCLIIFFNMCPNLFLHHAIHSKKLLSWNFSWLYFISFSCSNYLEFK